jgi:hypothetical protein
MIKIRWEVFWIETINSQELEGEYTLARLPLEHTMVHFPSEQAAHDLAQHAQYSERAECADENQLSDCFHVERSKHYRRFVVGSEVPHCQQVALQLSHTERDHHWANAKFDHHGVWLGALAVDLLLDVHLYPA